MAIIKSILVNVLSGASATIALLTVAVAYSDRLHPADYPTLSCAGMVFPFILAANLIMLMLWIMVSWRRSWIPLLGFLVSYPAIRTYIPLHFQEEVPTGCIKVLSYNVCCYAMVDLAEHPEEAIHDYLARQNADIVCLQEDLTGKPPYTVDYSDLYPYNDTVRLALPVAGAVNMLGIHSRYPILSKELIKYDSKANGSAAFLLDVDGDTVLVVNNHLESTHLNLSDRARYHDMIRGNMNREDTQAETRMLLGKLSYAMVKRSQQAEAVHHYVQSHSRYPVILCGDFNDSPISYARRTIASGLTDCYVESGCGLGISYNQKGFYFRIDQIMCSRHFEPFNCHVDNSILASDHYPIICWLRRR